MAVEGGSVCLCEPDLFMTYNFIWIELFLFFSYKKMPAVYWTGVQQDLMENSTLSLGLKGFWT